MIATGREREDACARKAIDAMTAWAGASVACRPFGAPVISPMHRGVDSLCFAAEVDGKPLLLKIVHPEMKHDIDVAAAFTAAAAAANAGVAPIAHAYLPEADAIVFERLAAQWRTARIDDLAAADTMAAVIDAKKKVQRTPALPRSSSVFDRLRTLVGDPDAVAPFGEMAAAVAAAQRIEAAFAAAGADTKPCHNDGLASNIMLSPDGAVRLVDFDAAVNTDPLYELGILLNEVYVFEAEMMPALEIYEGVARQQTLDRCRLYAIVDDLYWALWAGRLAAVSQRSGIEFLKYAQWRFLRCRMAMGEPDFERRLGAI